MLNNWFDKCYTSRLPIIAAINGTSPAAGTGLATCADYRIMINNPKVRQVSRSFQPFQYKIGLNEVRLGMAIAPHFCQPFAALVGQRRAEYLCQTGKMLNVLIWPTDDPQEVSDPWHVYKYPNQSATGTPLTLGDRRSSHSWSIRSTPI